MKTKKIFVELKKDGGKFSHKQPGAEGLSPGRKSERKKERKNVNAEKKSERIFLSLLKDRTKMVIFVRNDDTLRLAHFF